VRAENNENESLVGRRFVVTGGSLGIGAEITRGLLERGAEVLVACRDVARAEARRRELVIDGGERLTIVRLDVSSLAEVHAFAAGLAERWPRLDGLIHNAGASFPRRRLSVDGHELTFATNVLGGFALTRALRPLLREAGGSGRVVHVGSAAQYVCPLRSARLLAVRGVYMHERVYAHSKRAMFELSERWAEELDEEGITSTCCHPGLVATPGVADAFPRYFRAVGPLLPGAEVGADTAIWLASSPAVAGSTGGLWWRRARRPTDVVPWTRGSAAEREALWRLCERLTDAVLPVVIGGPKIRRVCDAEGPVPAGSDQAKIRRLGCDVLEERRSVGPRIVAIESCSRIPGDALGRLVTRAFAEHDAGPVSLVTDGGAAPSDAIRLRFLDGGRRPPVHTQAAGPRFDVWVGSPGVHRVAGDLVLPEADALAPAMVGERVSPRLYAALGRLARAVTGRRVGVALSGGGAWCYAHLALLRALDAAGVPIDVIAGSSLGAAIGGLYAQRGAEGLDALLAAHRWVHLAAALSVVSTAAIERVIAEILGDVDVAALGAAGPLVIAMAVDLVGGAEHPIRHGSLAFAARASCGFPGVYGPTLRDGRRLIDGALADNVPVGLLRAEGADLIVAANTFAAPRPLSAEPPRGRLGRVLATLSPFARLADASRAALILGSRFSARLAREADVVFAPDLAPYRLTDWHCAHAIVDRAAAEARLAAQAAASRFAAIHSPRLAAQVAADRLAEF